METFENPISSLDEDLLLEKGVTENIEEFIWDNEALQSDVLDTQIINLSNQILIQAIEKNASAIHIEPLEDSLRIRFRIDDVLHQPFERFPAKISSLIIDRFKIMADLFLGEQTFSQLGIIRRIYQRREVDFLVDTIPNCYGEKIVLRIRDVTRVDLNLDQLIIDRQTLQLLRKMIRRPFGLVLVTCPAGYGMTTTLYSLLAELNKPDLNICATSDKFFEYSLPGITQVESKREKGLGLDQIIQGFRRQDPDVIVVDEIRGRPTTQAVIEAAERCLVLAGLHIYDAPGAIVRLDEIGIEPFMVSHVLIGAISQRLLRRVCPDCAIPYTPTTAELAQFGLSAPIHEI
ncbi:MAG TPA: ATPase, T2SS/T4P/T4SS family, partial [Oculatellaceae cyanobacterium]